jgi:hypothetical protein
MFKKNVSKIFEGASLSHTWAPRLHICHIGSHPNLRQVEGVQILQFESCWICITIKVYFTGKRKKLEVGEKHIYCIGFLEKTGSVVFLLNKI